MSDSPAVTIRQEVAKLTASERELAEHDWQAACRLIDQEGEPNEPPGKLAHMAFLLGWQACNRREPVVMERVTRLGP